MVDRKDKVVVLASGGIDSTTLLWHYSAIVGTENVTALTVSYGQRHLAELKHIAQLIERLGCSHRDLDLRDVFRESKSALAGDGCSSIHLLSDSYEQQAQRQRIIPTNVELRNLVFVGAAASYAMQIGASVVAIGVHASDFAYPDCGKAFIDSLQGAVLSGSAGKVRLETPFIGLRKEGVIACGRVLQVPYELTWSCYADGETPCGKCASCIDRNRAFIAAGFDSDPAVKNNKNNI